MAGDDVCASSPSTTFNGYSFSPSSLSLSLTTHTHTHTHTHTKRTLTAVVGVMAPPMAIGHTQVGGVVGGAQEAVAGALEEDGLEIARGEAVDPVREPLPVWFSFVTFNIMIDSGCILPHRIWWYK